MEDLVLRCGTSYIPPTSGDRTDPKNCFVAAARLADDNPELTYVEGYGRTTINVDFPFEHAWCIDDDGNVIDPAWGTVGTAYLGIAFSDRARRKLMTADKTILFSPDSRKYLTAGLPDTGLSVSHSEADNTAVTAIDINPVLSGLGDKSDVAPVVIWDVDNVLNPQVPTDAHIAHTYEGPGPNGTQVAGTVFLNPEHGQWMAELTAAGATHAWATSWGTQAAEWIAPRLYAPAATWPVIDVGTRVGEAFGHSMKAGPIKQFLGEHRPGFWIDDIIGGKDHNWANDRNAAGIPTVFRQIAAATGLARDDIDAALAWLSNVAATRK